MVSKDAKYKDSSSVSCSISSSMRSGNWIATSTGLNHQFVMAGSKLGLFIWHTQKYGSAAVFLPDIWGIPFFPDDVKRAKRILNTTMARSSAVYIGLAVEDEEDLG